MLTIAKDATIQAGAAAVWRAWRPSYPMRPREEEARNLDLYDLAYGLRVPVHLVAVEEMRRWTVEHALPGGRLVVDHWMEPAGEGRVRVGKRYEVHGPMSLVYRLLFARRIRRSLPAQLAALESAAGGRA